MTIRKQPSDFIVREVLAEDVARAIATSRGNRRHALYELRKESLTTPEAAAALARTLRVRPQDVSYAGLKDKHARTTQHVTAALRPNAPAPPLADGPRWTARFLGWLDHPLAAVAIERNEFDIVVRDLPPTAVAEMDRRAAILRTGEGDHGSRLLIVNYFGDQRFGSARHGEGFAARHMVRGEFETALRLAIATPARKDTGLRRRFTRLAAQSWGTWAELAATLPPCPERRAVERLAAGAGFDEAIGALPRFLRMILIEAYQSYLWNQTAHRLVSGLAPPTDAPGARIIAADDRFGTMLFPAPSLVPEPLRCASVPMLAPGIRLTEPWGAAAQAVLQAEGLSLDNLRLPPSVGVTFGSAERPLFVEATGVRLDPPEPDGPRLKRLVRFALPRGAYATVVLRALGQ